MDKLVWQLPLGAKFEFEQLEDGRWKLVHFNRDQEIDFEEVHFDVIPALAHAATIISKAYVMTEIQREVEAKLKEGMH